MIRIDSGDSWLLLGHKEHAELAGAFARHWKNENFEPPKPFAHILDAVSRHDDSWEKPDTSPSLTPEMQPSAFTKELVGSYDAFEEIDLPEYLAVRAEATETAALRDPYSAVLISMHTVNLLTVQADLSALTPPERTMHSDFIKSQIDRQEALKAIVRAQPDMEPYASEDAFRAGFEFLQACDSFSLYVSVAYESIGMLQHTHRMRNGEKAEITITPKGKHHYTLSPYPLDEAPVRFRIPFKRVSKSATTSLSTYRTAYREASIEWVTVTVSKSE